MSRPAISPSKMILRPTTRVASLLLATVASAGAIASVASGMTATASSVKTVSVADDMFTPTKVNIHKGQQVKWVWSSTNTMPHNVTLTAGPRGVSAKKFTSKTRMTNYVFIRRFTVPGKYVFHCTIHYFMKVTVIVSR